jgi:chemotaxis protein MotA
MIHSGTPIAILHMIQLIKPEDYMSIVTRLTVAVGFLAYVLTVFRDISVGMIFNLDAFLIVVGGTTLAVLVGFPYKRVRDTAHDVSDSFKDPMNRDQTINSIVNMARVFRKGDIRNTENRIENLQDPFLKRGLNLLINRNNDNMIRNVLEREMMIRMINYNFSQNLLKTVARLTPSFGLAGTVISLVRMFNNFQSMEEVAPLMGLALMSTLYGVIISNLIVLPLGAKLKERAIMSETLMHITVEGIIAIKNMEHPLRIEERLSGYQWSDDLNASPAVDGLALAGGHNA